MRKELIELKDQAMKQRIETILECERMIIDARKEASQIIEYQKREGTE
jgi:F0F1-type ATP synthase membrane subunit b/b'